MVMRKKKAARDIEKGYPAKQFVDKLRRSEEEVEFQIKWKLDK
jgi:hypothetical protein